jgi:hypothetical protein
MPAISKKNQYTARRQLAIILPNLSISVGK